MANFQRLSTDYMDVFENFMETNLDTMKELRTTLLTNAICFKSIQNSNDYRPPVGSPLIWNRRQTIFWIIGSVLLLFTPTFADEIVEQRSLAVLLIIIPDMLWVIGRIVRDYYGIHSKFLRPGCCWSGTSGSFFSNTDGIKKSFLSNIVRKINIL